MPIPVPNLDDRRFDDLVEEAKRRLSSHLPELTQLAPGDPVHSIIDLFAFYTETILYRANLIPERQRRVMLNLLQIPLRPAKPSRGVVCIDTGSRSVQLPTLLRAGTQLSGKNQHVTTLGELQPTPLSLSVAVKQALSEEQLGAMGLSSADLKAQFGLRASDTPQAFQPRHFELGKDTLSLQSSIDGYFYLAMLAPKPIVSRIDELRENLAGITLNVAIAPADDIEEDEISSLKRRTLLWELMSENEENESLPIPLEVIEDSSIGGRQCGTVRLRLPNNVALLTALTLNNNDPMYAGFGDSPPELPAAIATQRIAFWLRLSCPDEPKLSLGYLGVNGIDITGQGIARDVMLGIGTGRPEQSLSLGYNDIDADSLQLDVEEEGHWVPWQRQDFLIGFNQNDRVFQLDASAGVISFGDGLDGGMRPPAGKKIRAAQFLFGGGNASNLRAGEIKELQNVSERLSVRHEWPCSGGRNAETLAQAERRLPQYLSHRNRAITKTDFQWLVLNNPVNPVARVDVAEGLLPGNRLESLRENVPGVVSVFVLPPQQPPTSRATLRATPRPSRGLLKDIFQYLLDRVAIGTELYVLSPEFIPLAIGISIDVLDKETEQETVQAVQNAIVSFLWPLAPGGIHAEGWPMGGNVKTSELITQAARVAGVRSVNKVRLFTPKTKNKQWRTLGLNEELSLTRYQLPELLGVSVSIGNTEPPLPGGLEVNSTDSRTVPAPVIPEVC